MDAHITFTTEDEKTGYKNTKEALKEWNLARLIAEYTDLTRHALNNIHGHNAAQFRNLVAGELISRGKTTFYDIFGERKITIY